MLSLKPPYVGIVTSDHMGAHGLAWPAVPIQLVNVPLQARYPSHKHAISTGIKCTKSVSTGWRLTPMFVQRGSEALFLKKNVSDVVQPPTTVTRSVGCHLVCLLLMLTFFISLMDLMAIQWCPDAVLPAFVSTTLEKIQIESRGTRIITYVRRRK